MYGLLLAVTTSGPALGVTLLNRLAITIVEVALFATGVISWPGRRRGAARRARVHRLTYRVPAGPDDGRSSRRQRRTATLSGLRSPGEADVATSRGGRPAAKRLLGRRPAFACAPRARRPRPRLPSSSSATTSATITVGTTSDATRSGCAPGHAVQQLVHEGREPVAARVEELVRLVTVVGERADDLVDQTVGSDPRLAHDLGRLVPGLRANPGPASPSRSRSSATSRRSSASSASAAAFRSFAIRCAVTSASATACARFGGARARRASSSTRRSSSRAGCSASRRPSSRWASLASVSSRSYPRKATRRSCCRAEDMRRTVQARELAEQSLTRMMLRERCVSALVAERGEQLPEQRVQLLLLLPRQRRRDRCLLLPELVHRRVPERDARVGRLDDHAPPVVGVPARAG